MYSPSMVERNERGEAKNGKSLHGREHASDTRPFQMRKETKCRDAKAVSDPFIVTPAKQYKQMVLVMQICTEKRHSTTLGDG